MIEECSPQGVVYLEIACGENERAALDYLQHYRSPHCFGLDADYSLSQTYHAQGWPTFVVVDSQGYVRFHGFPKDDKLVEIRQCLQRLLANPSTTTNQALPMAGGIGYPAAVLAARQAQRDRAPRLVLDRQGNPKVVYYSNRSGTNSIYLRQLDKNQEFKEEQVSPPGVESYAPDAVYDPAGTLWVTWCARNRVRYDIYIQSRLTNGLPKTQPLTTSDDDAMCPRLAAGPDGVLTAVYYKWHKLNGISRDRDIFARTYQPGLGAWGEEKEISPHEPEVEDHTDPTVARDKDGNAWIVWSYDYHPQLYKAPLDADQPTIFAAIFRSNRVSAPMLVGTAGLQSHAIDLFPTAAFDAKGRFWCAWDADDRGRRIKLARFDPEQKKFETVNAFNKADGICSTPELAAATGDQLLLTWSERAGGRWQGKVTLLKNGILLANTTLKENADVLFPQARVTADGQYWVAFEQMTETGSAIIVRNITREMNLN